MTRLELIKELQASLDGKPALSWRSLAEACVSELVSLGAANKEPEEEKEGPQGLEPPQPPEVPAGAKLGQSNPASSTQNKS